jgi:hypothetical protein
LPSESKSFAVPIGKFQSDVLRALAAQRSPDSYIAGGVAHVNYAARRKASARMAAWMGGGLPSAGAIFI